MSERVWPVALIAARRRCRRAGPGLQAASASADIAFCHGLIFLVRYLGTTAVTSISSNIPWIARPLITRNVLAGIGIPA